MPRSGPKARHTNRDATTTAGPTGGVVRYALRVGAAPMAVATYTYDPLPPAGRTTLTAADAVTAAFSGTADLDQHGHLSGFSEVVTDASRGFNPTAPT